uniref:Uncharacterized protein n=1 Tax=Panagrolaimus davidi TaxID=227884 RepID=A0A914QIM0_9BILA
MNNYILFLLLINLFNAVISEYAYWQNGEGPIIFNDPPSIQEQTNFPFHNVQFETNNPKNFVEIPSYERSSKNEREETIGDKINSLLPNQKEKQKVLEIVDSRNKSLLQKITELSRVFSKSSSRSHGIDQSELFHDMVETDRKRQNTLHQLRKSLTPEFIDIADKIVKVEKNFSLSDLQKQAGHDNILGSLAASAKSAMKDFETFLKSSPRTRRQSQTGPEWNMRSSMYVKPGTEGAYISDLPTAAPATNNNYADMLTKNRFIMPSAVEKQKFYPPAGFFPQEPTRPSVIFTGEEPYPIPGFTPPPPFTTTAPAPFGQDLSETYNDKSFADRNRLFRKPERHYDDDAIVYPPPQQQQRYYNNQLQQQQQPPPRWNIETQLVEKAQQTIIHTKTPITPDLSRNELTVKNKVENVRVPPGTITNFSQQTISQASIPAISNPPRDQIITKSHIETIRPAASGQSYGGSYTSNNNNIPSMDVRVSAGSMPVVPASIIPLSSGSIGRYETDIGRYDIGEGRQNLRFEIPQTFLQNIQSKIPGIVEANPNPYLQNVVNSYGPVNPHRQSPYGSNTGLPPNYIPSNQPIGQYVPSDRQYPPGSYIPPEYQQKPSQGDIVNTRILTNEQFQPNIIPEPNTVVLKESSAENLDPSLTTTTTTTTEPPPLTPYTTYPDFREDLFPIPLNHAKSDNRPAGGTYIRRQDMFGGGTNEYRQDLGRVSEKIDKEINNQKQWPSAVDDRRVKGYIDPEVRYGPASPPFSIENYPKPPYDGTSIAERPSGYMEGDDLSRTDVIGGIPYGRTDAMFTTPIPWNTQTTTIINVPSIDIDPKLDFPGNRAARPTQKEIIENRLIEDARRFPEKGQIRPYFGPEEITRSRYINENPPENNQKDGKIHRYVKIDLPNSSTLS